MKLALITNMASGVFQASVRKGAGEVLEARGLTLSVLEPPVSELAGIDGALVLANVLTPEQLGEIGGAVTLVSHSAHGADLPTVMHDNEQGMRQLFDYLFDERGCRRPLLLGGEGGQLDAVERERAFRENLMRRGLNPDDSVVIEGAFEPALAASRLEAHMAAASDFDCVIGADYLMALAAVPVLARHGLAGVPVAGFGDGPEAEAAGLTTVAADVVELGRRAARQLLGQLAGGEPGGTIRGRTLLSTQLVRRN